MDFFAKSIEVLQTLVIALGGGLCVWGGINLLEGYGDVYKRQVAEYGKEVRKSEQRISEFTASHPAGRHERSRSLSAGAER